MKKFSIIRKILIGLCITIIVALLCIVGYAIYCIATGGLLEIPWLEELFH